MEMKMANPLLVSIQRAIKDDRETARLFARLLGTKEHPRGDLVSTYRTHRRAMKAALNESRRDTQSILLSLQSSVVSIIRDGVNQAIAIGQESARVQTSTYADNGVSFFTANATPPTNSLTSTPVATLNQQVQGVQALISANAAVEEIIGDGTRLGLLQPAPVQRESAKWMAAAVSSGFWWWIFGGVDTPPPNPWRRQAIAGIDERTTDCCLRVHGQIVNLNEDFKLTGTPRYADFQRDPPFHDYCRTSVALYMEQFDDGFTKAMRQAASLERELRGQPGYKPPHPANAFTRIRK